MHTPYPYTDAQLKTALVRTTRAYIRVANRRFGCDIPEDTPIEFVDNKTAKRGQKMKALGEASYTGTDASGLRIRYNLEAMRKSPHAMQNIVAPHEVCHLVVMRKFSQVGADVQGHGAEWCFVMKRFGKDPQKYLDTYKAEWELLKRARSRGETDEQDNDQDHA